METTFFQRAAIVEFFIFLLLGILTKIYVGYIMKNHNYIRLEEYFYCKKYTSFSEHMLIEFHRKIRKIKIFERKNS